MAVIDLAHVWRRFNVFAVAVELNEVFALTASTHLICPTLGRIETGAGDQLPPLFICPADAVAVKLPLDEGEVDATAERQQREKDEPRHEHTDDERAVVLVADEIGNECCELPCNDGDDRDLRRRHSSTVPSSSSSPYSSRTSG